jgi:hypothetical protein
MYQNIYTVMIDNKWCVVSAGKPGIGYDDVKTPVISDDGNLYAFSAKTGDKWKLVVCENGNKKFSLKMSDIKYDDIENISISPDNTKIVFAGKGNDKYRLMVFSRLKEYYKKEGNIDINISDHLNNTIVSGSHPDIMAFEFGVAERYDMINNVVFSPDSQHFAFIAKRNKAWYLIADGEVVEKCEGIDYLTYDKKGNLIYAAKNAGYWQVHVGNKIGKQYVSIRKPVLSNDCNKIAYAAKIENKWTIVVDDETHGKIYDDVGQPVFSNQGLMTAYAAKNADKWFMVLDGHEMEKFDSILNDRIIFEADFSRSIDKYGILTRPAQVRYLGVINIPDQTTKKIKKKIIEKTDMLEFVEKNNDKK